MSRLIETAKTIAKEAIRRHYAKNHIRAARAMLAGLETMYGPLNRTDRRLCDAYAVEVLGHPKFAHWLHVYAHAAGQFKEGWIPDNFYDECVVPHTSGPYGELSGLRGLNITLFDAPEFPDLAILVNGMIIGRDGKALAEKDLAEVLFSQTDRAIFKSDASQSGVGVKIIDRANFSPELVKNLGSGLFQTFIRQHELFQRLGNSPAVATLRLTTAATDDGSISLRAAFLRFGQGSQEFVLSDEEVSAVVDLSTGELAPIGYMPSWERVDRHPQSDLPFAGQFIPNYHECVSVVLRCHARMPFIRCIGWDITVDTEGAVKIMEWNGGHNGIEFTEAMQGPCFADLNWHRYRRPASA
jgi:Sugar-transfer associated ATP-grasp